MGRQRAGGRCDERDLVQTTSGAVRGGLAGLAGVMKHSCRRGRRCRDNGADCPRQSRGVSPRALASHAMATWPHPTREGSHYDLIPATGRRSNVWLKCGFFQPTHHSAMPAGCTGFRLPKYDRISNKFYDASQRRRNWYRVVAIIKINDFDVPASYYNSR